MALNPNIADVAERLLGKPSGRTRRELRYGGRGSLSIRLDWQRWRDFESGERGDVIDLVRRELGCGYREALAWLGTDDPPPQREPSPAERWDDNVRRERAAAIWREAVSLPGTLAERYLAGRGLSISPGVAKSVLRFHPSCPFAGTRRFALVALFQDIRTSEPRAIQRTPLDQHGRRARDDTGVKIAKLSLGPTGGCAVMLTPRRPRHVGLAEGVESALGALQLGEPDAWATGGAGALSAFPILPGRALRIFADADAAGIAAARKLGRRWADAGQSAHAFIPEQDGADFADLAKAEAK